MRRKLYIMGMVVSLCIAMNSGIKVQAEDMDEMEYETIYRPATGDLEELKAICVPEEKLEDLQVGIAMQQEEAVDDDIQTFLELGSDYGYQDMEKRSNSDGRQALYEMMYNAAIAESESGEDAKKATVSGTEYSIVTVLNGLEEYDFTRKELMETYFTFRNDNPQFFWLSNAVVYGMNQTNKITSISLITYDEYASWSERFQTLEEIMKTGEDVYLSKILDTDDTYTIVKKIHDALAQDIDYDYDHMNEIGPAHSIAGAMTSTKKAVCEGYSKVMQLMMNCYGIDNIYVTGTGNGGGHAWNLAGMDDGKYYWLDATWDDQTTGVIYNYFLVGNNHFLDHTADTPNNQSGNFLYELPVVSDTDYIYNPSEVVVTKGDINGDSVINISDLMLCLNHVSQKSLLKGKALLAADINGDGNITITDLMRLLNYVSGKSATL